MTDEELRRALSDSDEAGWRALHDGCFRYIYTIVYRILHGSAAQEDVEECVADVMLEVLRSYDASHGGSVKALAGTVARRRAIDLRRHLCAQSKYLSHSQDEADAPDMPSSESVEETVEQAESCHILLEAILALGEPDTAIILQKYFYDRRAGEIAKSTGLSPAAVRMRASRAVRRLRTALKDKGITF
ncbi:MAG: sigma-70 family RNA polymerase sigma factor [Ruminococcus sp.]|nr:sigma-70 family RNA polymerase sigma factor [Ruminococcus sp.]MBQ7002441.1 sigma-70 family RNA polymerase sigma factor [Oscillospiraceae bacterium]